jgi:hypothetical protein
MLKSNLANGIVGVVFGGLMTLGGLFSGTPGKAWEGPAAMGQFAALVLGFVFLVAGLYYLRKGLRERSR